MQAESHITFAFLPNIGGPELLLILFIVLLLFGAKKLPELARGLGKSMHEFKKAASDIETDFRQAMDSQPQDAGQKTKQPAEQKTPPPPVSPEGTQGRS